MPPIRPRSRPRSGTGPRPIFVESLANPGGVVVDLEALADIAHEASIPLIVDNTLATPYLCRPFEWGADLVVHSLTKFLSGHGTSMGGIVVESGRFDWGERQVPVPRRAGPGLPRPRLLRDVRRLRLLDEGPRRRAARSGPGAVADQRVPHPDRHRDAAAPDGSPRRERARGRRFLAGHPAVAWVSYAGLPRARTTISPRSYLPKGPAPCSRSASTAASRRASASSNRSKLWSHLANVGDTRSLILHPASTTHRQLSDEERIAAGAGPDVIRLSVGIEAVADLIADLDQALTSI